MSEHEGPLSNREVQQARQKNEAKLLRQNREDLRALAANGAFRRWFGRYSESVLPLDIRTTNGGDIQHFMGRRSLVLEMKRELEQIEPAFYEAILATRRNLMHDLLTQEKEDDQ